MSTPINPGQGAGARALQILTLANTAAPIAIGGVSALISIIKREGSSGKTDAEIQAEWEDSMATALRTRAKKDAQMSNQA